MPIISHSAFSDYLSKTPAAGWPAVTLVYGEDLLVRKTTDAVAAHLIPEADRATDVEGVDGADADLAAVMAKVNTYALFSSQKLVVLRDARIFYSAQVKDGLREKVAQAAQKGEMKKAARSFLSLLSLLGLTFDDLKTPAVIETIAASPDGVAPAWLLSLVSHCRENNLKIPEKQDDGEFLRTSMEKGFPDGNRLVITTDMVDRRKTLFKALDKTGLIVDCSVPKGETRADRTAQEQVMRAAIAEALSGTGKTLAPDACRRLMEWTGFDLRTLSGSLEKLVSFTGERKTITDADVTAILHRTRKDPIFAFTNALADRNLAASLMQMRQLLADDMHPLQLLAAAVNQIRRLLAARAFIDRDQGRTWDPRMNFDRFRGAPFKAIQADDAACTALVEEWDAIRTPPDTSKKKKQQAGTTDLMLVKNPNSPFPVFQLLSRASRFSFSELSEAVIALSQTDRAMKSTGQDPVSLMEAFLIRFCGRKAHRV